MANLMSPVAPCVWPFLNKPDTRWDKDGKYRVSLVFSPEDPFLAELEGEAEKAFNEAKAGMKPALANKLVYNSPVREEYDAEGEATGNMLVEFQTRAYFKSKEGVLKPIKLKVFDSFGRLIKGAHPNVGSGSELAIAYNPKPTVSSGKFYYTLYLNAFQIVTLVEFGGDYGFKAHEGGFDASGLDDSDSGVSGAEGSEF